MNWMYQGSGGGGGGGEGVREIKENLWTLA